MTELEALNLRKGDVVACRFKELMARFLVVTHVLDRDFTPNLAIKFLKCNYEVARKLAFDGPIIFTGEEIWSAPHVHFPVICYHLDCEICHVKYELQLKLKGYWQYRLGMRPSSICLPEESEAVTTFLDSKICRRCNPYYHKPHTYNECIE